MKGFLLVISGPSGVGKGTVVEKLLSDNEDLVLSTSVTTRYQRKGEIDGEDYYFIDNEEFTSMINNNELLEHAYVHGNFYGTPRRFVDEEIDKGHIVILEIDVQGAMQVKKNYENAAFIFIMPRRLKDIEKRLRNRGTESEEKISLRMQNSKKEMAYIKDYDYFVINHTVDRACEQIIDIIDFEKNRRD